MTTFEIVRSDRFVADPIGRCTIGVTYAIWCAAPDLLGSIQWGGLNDRDVREMTSLIDVARHPDLAPSGRVLMDCRDIDRVDAEVLLAFVAAVRADVPTWSPRIERHAVVVPIGLAGILLAGALPSLAPAHPMKFVHDLPAAIAYIDHPAAAASHAAAEALVAASRGHSTLIGRLRTALAHDLAHATIGAAAVRLGLSVRTLQRELRRAETTFREELWQVRIAAARQLLELSDLKIDAIAERVGLGTSSRMSAILRREIQLTAREVRARARSRP